MANTVGRRGATVYGHLHAEAFCHMHYQTADSRETEVLWNSRDGVTPMFIRSRSGKEMHHVNFHADIYEPNYKPVAGDRIFVTATRELLHDKAVKFVEERWEAGERFGEAYPGMKTGFESKEAAVEYFLDKWCDGLSPTIFEVTEDGNYPASPAPPKPPTPSLADVFPMRQSPSWMRSGRHG
jgi:hypothetical protein